MGHANSTYDSDDEIRVLHCDPDDRIYVVEVQLSLKEQQAILENLKNQIGITTKYEVYKEYKETFNFLLKHPKATISLFNGYFTAKTHRNYALPIFVSKVPLDHLKLIIYLEEHKKGDTLAEYLKNSYIMRYSTTPENLRPALKNENNEQKPIPSFTNEIIKSLIFSNIAEIAVKHYKFDTTKPIIELNESAIQFFINLAVCDYFVQTRILKSMSYSHPIMRIVSGLDNDDRIAENLAELSTLMVSTASTLPQIKSGDLIQNLLSKKLITPEDEAHLRLFEFIAKTYLLSPKNEVESNILLFFKNQHQRTLPLAYESYYFRVDFKKSWKTIMITYKALSGEILVFHCDLFELLKHSKINPYAINPDLPGLPDIEPLKGVQLDINNSIEKRRDENPEVQERFIQLLLNRNYIKNTDRDVSIKHEKDITKIQIIGSSESAISKLKDCLKSANPSLVKSYNNPKELLCGLLQSFELEIIKDSLYDITTHLKKNLQTLSRAYSRSYSSDSSDWEFDRFR